MNKENLITQIKKNSNEVYRISEKEYEGYRFIDVRIYYQDRKTQEWKPTTKGISIMPDKVKDIVELNNVFNFIWHNTNTFGRRFPLLCFSILIIDTNINETISLIFFF